MAVNGADVVVYGQSGPDGEWLQVAAATTVSSGDYNVSGLAAGTYRIGFFAGAEDLAWEYWNDQPTLATAQDVEVATDDETVTGKDAQLADAAHIAGSVTGPQAQPLDDVLVTAYQYDSALDDWVFGTSSDTDSSGDYVLGELPVGRYRIEFKDASGPHLTEYWNDELTLFDADDVVVAAGATVAGRDARLGVASHITGTVSEPSGPLADVVARAYRYDAESDSWDYAGAQFTSPTGVYDIGNLLPGAYRVGFEDSGTYVNEYWNDKPTLNEADDIVVGSDTTVTLTNAQLAVAGHITGTVTGPGGTPASQVGVSAYRYSVATQTWEPTGVESESAADGSYDLGGLSAGDFRVKFSDNSSAGLAVEFWDDASDIDSAGDIAVTAAGTTAGKDAQLGVGATISGRVTNQAGSGVRAVVSAFGRTASGSFMSLRYADTAGSGNYTIIGLPPGTYRLEFEPNDPALSGEYFDDTVALASATDVVISSTGQAVMGKDAVLTAEGPVLTNTALPSISGSPKVGFQLTVVPGNWAPPPESRTYQWVVGGVDIAGATGSSYTPLAADVGRQIAVREGATKAGYPGVEARSNATGAVAPGSITNTKPPAIRGKAVVGQKLTVSAATWTPGSVSLKFRWMANGKAIRGATGTSFKVKGPLVGMKITVRVVASATGYTATRVTTKATKKVKPKPKKPKKYPVAQ